MENKYAERFKEFWQSIARQDDDSQTSGTGIDREKIVVLAISLVLAFCLWLIVNLNRDFNLDVQVPVELGNITTDQSLAEKLPEAVTASVSGNGWNLINMYNDPPHIYVDVSGEEVNLFEQVRRQMSGNASVTVQKVEPLYLQVQLEPKVTKKVPVKPHVRVEFKSQYDFIGNPVVVPDSVTVSGAASRIENIESWPTDSLTLRNIQNGFSRELSLKESSGLLSLSESSVTYQANVEQYTEGEITVPVETRDFPVGNMVTFSPSSIRVKYRVPLSQYAQFGDGKTFRAYIRYAQVQSDTTGFVSPQIEKRADNAHLKVRSVRPREVAYFTIISNR